MIEQFSFKHPPPNLHLNYSVEGKRKGVSMHKFCFMQPVLSFVQPDENSDTWYVVTYRVNIHTDSVDIIYDSGGIDYELYQIHNSKDDYNLSNYNNGNYTSMSFVDGQNKEDITEALGLYYKEALTIVKKSPREEVNFEDLYSFLDTYKQYIINEKPHILV